MNQSSQPHARASEPQGRTLPDQQFVDLVRYVVRNDLVATPREFESKQEDLAERHDVEPPGIARFVQNSHAVVVQGAGYTEEDLKAAEAIWQYGVRQDEFQQKLVAKADEINRQLNIRPDLLKFELRMHGGPPAEP
ncbi:MAG: hypothetical protein KJ061_15195 [Vicinamibacteraceae bacterium]|nr:hypothetical protein [Vicinamibacteraceae bacterium]